MTRYTMGKIVGQAELYSCLVKKNSELIRIEFCPLRVSVITYNQIYSSLMTIHFTFASERQIELCLYLAYSVSMNQYTQPIF